MENFLRSKHEKNTKKHDNKTSNAEKNRKSLFDKKKQKQKKNEIEKWKTKNLNFSFYLNK